MLRKRNTDGVDACVLQTNGVLCHVIICLILRCNLAHFVLQSGSFHAMKWYELRGNLL